jgi:hypothetical protein
LIIHAGGRISPIVFYHIRAKRRFRHAIAFNLNGG